MFTIGRHATNGTKVIEFVLLLFLRGGGKSGVDGKILRSNLTAALSSLASCFTGPRSRRPMRAKFPNAASTAG